MQEVRRGRGTAAFARQAKARGANDLPDEAMCFSLMTNGRTVDLAALTVDAAEHWVAALTAYIAGEQEGVSTSGGGAGLSTASRSAATRTA